MNFQLDSADEQAAAIRRELDGRMQKVNEMERVSHDNNLHGLTTLNFKLITGETEKILNNKTYVLTVLF